VVLHLAISLDRAGKVPENRKGKAFLVPNLAEKKMSAHSLGLVCLILVLKCGMSLCIATSGFK
jgi:hypothetical protein